MESALGALQSISMLSLSCHKAIWLSRVIELGDREIHPRGQRELMLMFLMHCCCSGYGCLCTYVCFYTEKPWQGQQFSCHPRHYYAIGQGWQVKGVHVEQSSLWVLLCVHVCSVAKKRTLGYYISNVTIAESCRSTSPHEHNMRWPYPVYWCLGVITPYWYTGVNVIM